MSYSDHDIDFITRPGNLSGSVVLSHAQAERMTGLSRSMLDKLVLGGYLPDLNAHRIVKLSQRDAVIGAGEEQPILRTDSDIRFDALYGRQIGCRSEMDDGELLDATRGAWRCDKDRIIAAGFLPVSVGSVSVAALRIEELDESTTEVRTNKSGKEYTIVRHTFIAQLIARVDEIGAAINYRLTPTEDERRKCEILLGAIQTSSSGGPISYL